MTLEEGLTVTQMIHVEPAPELRARFARWGLDMFGTIGTTSTGFSVPVDAYPSIPKALLEGAYVDGYLYRGADPVPAARPDGSKPPERKDAVGGNGRQKGTQRRSRVRQSTQPGAAKQGGQKDTAVQDVVLGEASQEGSDSQ